MLAITETGPIRHYFIDHDTSLPEGIVPVGYPMEGMEIVLLDPQGREVGCDAPGEITVKSRYLALGYWRRPALTQSAFLSDPQGSDARIYHTGDIGLMREDGCLILLGRLDSQVKIRGQRVDIAAIEEGLLALDGIQAVAVVAHEARPRDQRLIAYLVPTKQPAPTIGEVQRFLRGRLPEVMLPAAVVSLAALPRLPSGKVDRRALAVPRPSRPALDIPWVAPRTPIEADLARLWASVLDLETVGVEDSFLELGGNSLQAAEILTRVEAQFRVALPLGRLLEAPTVAQMAAVIAQTQEDADAPTGQDCSGGGSRSATLVMIHPTGSQRPLVCVTPIGGGGFTFSPLARVLGPDQPIYVLEIPGRGPPLSWYRVERIAAECLSCLRRAQPVGPYALAGASFGGGWRSKWRSNCAPRPRKSHVSPCSIPLARAA